MALTIETAPDAPSEAPPDELRVTLRLGQPFAAWLAARAAAHGESVEQHAATLLRAYWANHDAWRHQGAATTRRPAP